jgi:hypothetical protein
MKWKTLIEEILMTPGWTKRRIAREVGVSEAVIYRLMRNEGRDMRASNGDRLRELHSEVSK